MVSVFVGESAPEAASWLSSFHSPACCLDRPATTPTNDWISGAAHFLLHAPHHLPQMMMTPLQCRDLPGGGQGGRPPADCSDCSPAFTLYKSATLNPRVSPREHRISPCAGVIWRMIPLHPLSSASKIEKKGVQVRGGDPVGKVNSDWSALPQLPDNVTVVSQQGHPFNQSRW